MKSLSTLILLFLIMSCSHGNDATIIRELIKKGVDLTEKHDTNSLMKLATDDFIYLPGKYDKKNTKWFLLRTFNYYKQFKIIYPYPDIHIKNENGASATFPFLIVRKEHAFKKLNELYNDPQRWLEEAGKSADLYRINLELIKERKKWKVYQATLEKFNGTEFKK